MNLKPHKFADALPDMTPADYEALKQDIKAVGQRDDVMLFEGQILDGRHRYRACDELGIKPRTRVFRGTATDAIKLVYSRHVRRNMDDGQKAIGAARLRRAFGSNPGKKGEKNPQPPSDLFGISERYIRMAELVEKKSSKLIKRVEAGELSLAAANRMLQRDNRRLQWMPRPRPRRLSATATSSTPTAWPAWKRCRPAV